MSTDCKQTCCKLIVQTCYQQACLQQGLTSRQMTSCIKLDWNLMRLTSWLQLRVATQSSSLISCTPEYNNAYKPTTFEPKFVGKYFVLLAYTAKNATHLLQVVNFIVITCQQVATNLSISSSCNKSVKIRLVATCHLQTCYNQ